MAVDALKHGVRTDKRETILVIADLLERYLPALDRVAIFAVSAKLAPVDVCMAIGAVSADVLKDQARVTPCAGNVCVHSAQGVTGLVVVELGVRPNGFPTGVGMAFLARSREGAVGIGYFCLWTAHTGPRAIGWLLHRSTRKQGHETNHNRSEPARAFHRSLRELQGPATGCDFETQSVA